MAELERLRHESPLVRQLIAPDTVRLLPAQFDAVAWGGIAIARRLVTARDTQTAERDETRALLEEVVAREGGR
jgi:hypothetical protein